MFLMVSKDYNIDLNNSWMIGKSDSDVQAGEAARRKSIKMEEGKLPEAIKIILK